MLERHFPVGLPKAGTPVEQKAKEPTTNRRWKMGRVFSALLVIAIVTIASNASIRARLTDHLDKYLGIGNGATTQKKDPTRHTYSYSGATNSDSAYGQSSINTTNANYGRKGSNIFTSFRNSLTSAFRKNDVTSYNSQQRNELSQSIRNNGISSALQQAKVQNNKSNTSSILRKNDVTAYDSRQHDELSQLMRNNGISQALQQQKTQDKALFSNSNQSSSSLFSKYRIDFSREIKNSSFRNSFRTNY